MIDDLEEWDIQLLLRNYLQLNNRTAAAGRHTGNYDIL